MVSILHHTREWASGAGVAARKRRKAYHTCTSAYCLLLMAAGRPPVIMETDGTERTTYDGLSCLPGGRPNSAVSVSAGPPAGEGDRALIVFSSSLAHSAGRGGSRHVQSQSLQLRRWCGGGRPALSSAVLCMQMQCSTRHGHAGRATAHSGSACRGTAPSTGL